MRTPTPPLPDLLALLALLAEGTATERRLAWTEITTGDAAWRGCSRAAQRGEVAVLLAALDYAEPLVNATPVEGEPTWLWDARCDGLLRLLAAALIGALAMKGATSEPLTEWMAWSALSTPRPTGWNGPASSALSPAARIDAAWQQLATTNNDRELAAIRDAALELLAIGTQAGHRVVQLRLQAPLLLTVGPIGHLGWFWAERVDGGAGELLRAPSTWLDPVTPGTLRAVEEAWAIVQADAPGITLTDVRWWLARLPQSSPDQPVPPPSHRPPAAPPSRPSGSTAGCCSSDEPAPDTEVCEIHGRSLQATAAALFYCLSCDRPYNASVAVSAELNAGGGLGAVGGFSGTAPKLDAALRLVERYQQATVVVSAENQPTPRMVAEWSALGVHLQIAHDLEELTRLVSATETPTSVPSGLLVDTLPDQRSRSRSPWLRGGRGKGFTLPGFASLAVAGVLLFGGVRMYNQLQQGTESGHRAALLGYADQLRNAAEALEAGDARRATSWLQQAPPSLREWTWQHLWLRAAGAQAVLPPEQPVPAVAVRFGPDSRTFVSAGEQGYLRSWDGQTARAVCTEDPLIGKPVMFEASTLSHFGDRLAVALVPFSPFAPGARWTLAIHDRATGQSWRLPGTATRVDAVALDNSGHQAAVATRDQAGRARVVLFRWEEGQWQQSSYPTPRRVRALAFSAGGETIASGGDGGMVHLWRDVAVRTLWTNELAVTALELAPDGRTVAVGGSTRRGSLVEIMPLDGRAPRRIARFPDQITDLSFDGAGTRMAATTSFGTVTLWECRTWREAAVVRAAGPKPAMAVAVDLSPDGRTLAVAEAGGGIARWSVTGSFPQRISWLPPGTSAHQASSPSLSQSLRVGGASLQRDQKGDVRFLPRGTGRVPPELSTPQPGALALSPAGRCAVAADANGIQLCEQGEGSWQLLPTSLPQIVLAISDDGVTLAGVDVHSTLTLWDLRSREKLAQFPVGPLLTGTLSGLRFQGAWTLSGRTTEREEVTWIAQPAPLSPARN